MAEHVRNGNFSNSGGKPSENVSHVVQQVPRVPEFMNFPNEEEKVVAFWNSIDAFHKSLELRKNEKRFSFYDGPPFATGLPHYGHILAGTIKDIVTRHASQLNYYCERRFGWDTHGLPVEFEIDKKFDIKGPEDVMKMGIANYNMECRKIVMRYAKDWEAIMGRIGRWIDFKNDYKSLYTPYMESIWWVFKQLYEKGLVYQGNKVMPYSTGCSTPLSNFESGQDYRDVTDPCVTVGLRLHKDPKFPNLENTMLLVWTTTPWTLPSNLAACVHPNLEYAHFEDKKSGNKYIMMECLIKTQFKEGEYVVIEKFNGRQLEGLRYEPIFPYFKERMQSTAFRVLCDEYVTAESGTGVVHQAPYFGEDDYRVCIAAGVVTKDQEPVCPLDAIGRFLQPVVDFEGMYVKEADKAIIADLKKKGVLVHQGQITHSYPFCWRSHTPLIYRSIPSWFIRVEQATDRLLENCWKTYWIPKFVRDKRFGNWLKNARDWSVSRNRYWGTPMPIWTNGQETICIGSIEELERLTNSTITDLHREFIDHLEIPSSIEGMPPLKRISEVFDCWFESGSMPYAQAHYPFNNDGSFEASFPADFIAEGVDQTRGWFYTLLVIGTLLFDKAPFRNCVANGLVLAADGQKMSKSKRNFPDPLEVVNKYGADALRMYLINSPIVRGENLRFREDGVREMLKDVFLPWSNSFRFMFLCIEGFVQSFKTPFIYDVDHLTITRNVMDVWIISYTETLMENVCEEMRLYKLYNVIPKLIKFIGHLTNCYLRLNRSRMKSEFDRYDCQDALMTLFHVLYRLMQIMSPFAPFFTETMYQYVRKFTKSDIDSVHFLTLPAVNNALINRGVELAVSRMQTVVELVRVVRERRGLPAKLPLPELIVVHQDNNYINHIDMFRPFIVSETNVRVLKTTTDRDQFGITLRAEPDYKVLGERLKQDFKKVTECIHKLKDEEIAKMLQDGSRTIAGHEITAAEIRPIYVTKKISAKQYEINTDNDVLCLLNATPDASMVDEGTAREIINRIQKLRKKAKLVPTDQISVFYEATGDLKRVAVSHRVFIEDAIKTEFKQQSFRKPSDHIIIEETQKFKNSEINIALTQVRQIVVPVVKWVNLLLIGNELRYGTGDKFSTALLEISKRLITLDELKQEVFALYGVEKCMLFNKDLVEINDKSNIASLSGQTIFVVPHNETIPTKLPECANGVPFCKVYNFNQNNVEGTIILENPKGNSLGFEDDLSEVVNAWIAAFKCGNK